MAGGISKTLGGILLAVGTVLLLAGIGAAAYGFVDQQENDEQLLSDPERSDQNEMLLTYGAVAAAAGLVVLVLGIVGLGIGGARARNALARGRGGQAPGTEGRGGGRKGAIAAVAVVAVLLTALVMVGYGRDGGGDGLLGSMGGQKKEVFEPFHGEGSMSAAFDAVLVQTAPQSDFVTFTAPEGAGRMVVLVNWTGDPLEVRLDRETGDGLENEATATGGPAQTFEVSQDVSGASFVVRLFPADPGPHTGQDYTVDVTFHAS